MKSYRLLKTTILLLFFTSNALVLLGQSGGRSGFRFLHLPVSARTNALGGISISEGSYDGASAVQNPALLQSNWHGFLSFNHQFYFGGIQHGYFNYVHHLSKNNITLHSGFQYVNYGKMIQTDEFEQEYGNFRAGEYAWYLGASKPVYERLTVGANLKIANSVLENYTSFAIAADLGARYHIEEKKISIGLVMANVGGVLTRYSGDSPQRLPYDVRLAITKRMEKAPFSITLTAHHLHRWNLLYENPEADNANIFQSEARDTRWDWLENTARHLQASAEIYIGKSENFILRLGYNHMRRRDLSVQNFRSIAGMSGGLGFKIKKLKLDYGFGTYHLAGSSHHISLSLLLSSFTKPNALP
jgi:hypothetical protein